MKKTNFLLIVIFFIYLLFAGQFKFNFLTSRSNYFNYLAEAFLQGKLSLISQPKNIFDLISFKNKVFLYWPPLPAIMIMPLIAIFGKNFSDVLYTSIVGGLNCLIFYFVLDELRKTRLIKFSQKTQSLITLFFSLGTVHFYLSLFGRVWFTSQIFALFFFLCSLWSIFKYYHVFSNHFAFLWLASFCLSLSFLGRNTFIFSLPFFLTMIYIRNRSLGKKFFFKSACLFLSLPLLAIISNGLYNFLRFGSFLENGYRFHYFNPQFDPQVSQFGFFNLAYLPINFFYNFLNPLRLKLNFPFINPNPQGNSIFFTSPLFIYLFKFNKKMIKTKKEKYFFGSVILSSLLMIAPSLMLFGTGWFQFGARYLLDIAPFLIFLLLPCLKNFKSRLAIILLAISIFINLMAYFWWKSLNIL